MNRTLSQHEAIQTTSPNTLVVAGPGSGKTFTLVQRVIFMIECQGINPDGIAVVTYTNEAARELENRIRTAREGIRIGYCGTLHGLALRCLRRFAPEKERKFSIIAEDEAMELLEESAALVKYKGSKSKLREDFQKHNLRAPSKETELTLKAFYQQLRDNGMVTYDLILTRFASLLVSMVAKGQSLPWGHLLVDEFQDASMADAGIYKAMPMSSRFFVGDPDQAIYGFRGGCVGPIMDMAMNPTTQRIKLEENFRSGPGICKVAQRLIEHSNVRISKKTVSALPVDGHAVTCADPLGTPEQEIVFVSEQLKQVDGQAAVLLRTNALVNKWADGLTAMGVQVRRRDTTGLPDDWRTARLYLSLLLNPDNDRIAFMAIRASRGAEIAKRVRAEAAKQLTTINRATLKLPTDMSLDAAVEQLGRMNVSQASRALIKTIRDTLGEDAALGDLVVAVSGEQYRGKEEGEGVTVTTLHSAKGREWDFVFLPSFVDEMIPGKHDVEEERRLAYVGVTRARKAALITYSKTCRRVDTKEFRSPDFRDVKPSRFLAEMGLVAV